jgi:phage-related protein
MDRQWKVLFYRTINGKCPVESFLDGLKPKERAKAVAWIGMLQEHGINLHRPFADLLEDGIHELRMKISGDQNRVLYFFCFKNVIVLTHDFIKTTDKVPAREITLAKKCRMDFLQRYNEKSVRGL